MVTAATAATAATAEEKAAEEKEKVVVTKEEITEQIDMLNAQARQKNEPLPDARRAADEIENVLLRRKIFNFLAKTAEITWVDAPEEPAKA